MKKILCLIVLCTMFLQGCGNSSMSDSAQNSTGQEFIQTQQMHAGNYLATINTSLGTIKIELYPNEAPKAVENFIELSKKGYYDGIKFHRVIQDFMIQGGDPTGTGRGGESIWKKPFNDEFSDKMHHFNGALSMANSGPNTNGSQFFIVQNDDGSQLTEEYFKRIENQSRSKVKYSDDLIKKYQELGGTPHLDGMHTVFGQVVEGMDVVKKIAFVETDGNDTPLEDVIIKNISIEEIK